MDAFDLVFKTIGLLVFGLFKLAFKFPRAAAVIVIVWLVAATT